MPASISQPPKLDFLRAMLPSDLDESEIAAEEMRMLEHIAQMRRIAERKFSASNRPIARASDSTLE